MEQIRPWAAFGPPGRVGAGYRSHRTSPYLHFTEPHPIGSQSIIFFLIFVSDRFAFLLIFEIVCFLSGSLSIRIKLVARASGIGGFVDVGSWQLVVLIFTIFRTVFWIDFGRVFGGFFHLFWDDCLMKFPKKSHHFSGTFLLHFCSGCFRKKANFLIP